MVPPEQPIGKSIFNREKSCSSFLKAKLFSSTEHRDMLLPIEKRVRCRIVEKQREKATMGNNTRLGSVEGVIIVNGRPQIERIDMPLAFSFDSVESLERFCKNLKSRGQS